MLDALAAADDIAVDAFLCPAHVSAIIGARVYEAFAERHTKPCVVAGFEPLDILYGVAGLLEQLARREASVVNQYGRVVRSEGNPRALSLMNGCLETAPAVWRGLGEIPDSGYRLRPAFAAFDAESRFGVSVTPGRVHPGCRCGDVLKGMIEPPQCRLFGRACTPEHPYGPCMVSSEGSCAARYKYARCA
ncbi:MAG: hydrogenase formation protein HypD [Deltaproteobacteria bacterium]|nr:hydrogenase formation protein HypD [Deltaproteobacteria bacterium]